MYRRSMCLAFCVLAFFLAASASLAADGENIFQFAYSHADDDTIVDSMVRGACAGSDLDQDGLYEIIVTDYDNGGQVHVYEVTGDNTLAHVWSSPGSNGTSLRQVHTGDMDNDGIGEIIFVVCDGTWSTTYEGGIHVYEWDGLTDNGYGTAAVSIYKPNPTHPERFRTEDFTIGDVDGDGQNELVTCDNTITSSQDGLYILSVTGTFESGFATWNEEGVWLRTGANPFGGSPTNTGIGDLDGDGAKEAIFGIWDYAALYIVEATAPNTYAYQTYIQIDTTGDGVCLDNFVVADLNGDSADEVYMNIYGDGKIACITGGVDVSTITFEGNVTYIAYPGETGAYGMGIGDQDHGWGSDGPDLYIAAYTNGRVYDHELDGADPTDSFSWTRYTLWEDLGGNSTGSFGIDVPPVDMDKDGRLEVVVTYLEPVPPEGKWFRVFEWAGEPVSVTLSSFEALGAEEQVELTWRVESEVSNSGYRVYRDGTPIAFVEGRGNSDSPLTYTWIDKDVTAGTIYRYRIADVDLNGNETVHDIVAEATPKPSASGQVPTTYALAQNYPNPFNADTQIQFSLAQAGYTTLKIYNTTGQLIRTLVDGHLDARMHRVRWDGRNSSSELVASGIYFYRLSSGNFTETKKMSFLK